MAWLKLIRWKNLAIILLTQFVVWWYVIFPEAPIVLGPLNFSLLALSTLLIAAAGYIINDYFDIKIDLINRPEKVVLEKIIPRKQAIISHTVLNIIALLLAGYVAGSAGHFEWLLVQAACTVLLWFYSTDFKRQYMIGNIVVALLAALTVIVLFIYEPVLQQEVAMPIRSTGMQHGSSLPAWVLGIYAYFAFMLTWTREIVKDMEDFIGDEAEGCITMPVRKGLLYSVNITLVLAGLVAVPLALATFVLYHYAFHLFAGYVGLITVALISWCIFLGRDTTPLHYHRASRGLKIIMLLGICSLFIYRLQLFAYNA